jgi:hypothetical protein
MGEEDNALVERLAALIRSNVQVTVYPDEPCSYDYEVDAYDAAEAIAATIERLSAALEGLADAAGECRAALWAIEDSAVEAGFDRMGDIIAERLAKLNPAIDEARTALGKDASDDQGE